METAKKKQLKEHESNLIKMGKNIFIKILYQCEINAFL